MNETLAKLLFQYVDEQRGTAPVSELLQGWLEKGADAAQRREHLQVWMETVGAGHAKEGGEFFSSMDIASFMAKLGTAGASGQAVLDPTCGLGLLLSLAADGLGASVIHGIEKSVPVAKMAELILPASAEVFQGDCLQTSLPDGIAYDLIISEPPFNTPVSAGYSPPPEAGKLSYLSDALLFLAAALLSPSGRAVFLLPASCLNQHGKGIWKSLAAEDLHVRAMIHVPSGHLKATAIESYIVVLDRTPRETVFTAQYSNDGNLQREMIAAFEAHQPRKRAAQGRLVNFDSFQGFKASEATEQIEEVARRKGLKPVAMSELVIDHQVFRGAPDAAADSANDLYLSLFGRFTAVLHPAELTAKSSKTVRLVINGELADARFLAASLNDDLGRMFFDTISSSLGTIKQINLRTLLGSTFYLPDVKTQNQALEVISRIHALRASLDEIESAVWAHPLKVEKQIQQVRRVNHEDTLESWLEGLPFPLASIMWRYRASNGAPRDKSEILLHFFEALAEFWATIYLSAAKSDREFWADHLNGLHEVVGKAKLTFDLATFGLWKCVIEFLSSKFRSQLSKDEDRCTAMFRTTSRGVIDMLLDRRLITVLQAANSIRNSHAHGGVASTRDSEIEHAQLFDLIQSCRSVMGLTWERYELVQPCECRLIGGVWDKVHRVMGTRTPFATETRKTVEGMEDGALHLLDPDGERGLKLLALIRVMPSPKTEANACYFYNRKGAHQQKFVSYHFEADSEVEAFFADTQAALDGLKPFVSSPA